MEKRIETINMGSPVNYGSYDNLDNNRPKIYLEENFNCKQNKNPQLYFAQKNHLQSQNEYQNETKTESIWPNKPS